jgi:ABC-type oligopeptide transport system substrate-binding subunit
MICRAGWVGDYLDPSTFLTLWQTGDGNNNTGWGSKRYDELINQSFLEGDPAKRLPFSRRPKPCMLNEAPMLPVYWYTAPISCVPRSKACCLHCWSTAATRQSKLITQMSPLISSSGVA